MKSKDSHSKTMQSNMKPLNMNGLNGRMLQIPSTKVKNREILLIYGHHASLERIYGIAESLSDYGNVTVPDLPGCGGMQSFYSIDMVPSIDNMADYLASFIKLRYRGKKVTVIGMSLGFVIVTRMLQRYPSLSKKIDLLISIVGFSHKYDFSFSKNWYLFYLYGAKFFTLRPASMFFYNVFLHPAVIRAAYSKTHNAKKKMESLSTEEAKRAIDFEVNLWRNDDIRTYMIMTTEMLQLDNCRKQVDLPVHHISVDSDQYFDHSVVEQHLRIIFTDFTEHIAKIPNHAPSVIANKKEAAPFVPKSIRSLLTDTEVK